MAILAPGVIVLYAALLRFDALVGKFGVVAGSERVEAVERSAQALGSDLRPADAGWNFVEERRGDPKSYLKIARAKQSFYEPSAREPLFLATIQTFLWITGDQDISVNCASALYSVLLVAAAYWLGSYAFSRMVGLGAAAFLAIEAQAIGQGVDGWRDDSFAFFAVMTVYGLLRLRREPSLQSAAIAGLFAAASCLVRLSALSFILPGALWLLVDGPREAWRKRAVYAGVALGICGALIAPFLVANALAYGDPFYSVDFATEFYRGRAKLPVDQPLAWAGHFADRLGPRPLETVDSLARGFTAYPFANKWHGFGYHSALLGPVLAFAAIAGLFLFVVSAEGRLLLVTLFAGLLPFAAIWETRTGAQWRFTLFAYPFYLIAACEAPRAAMALMTPEYRGRVVEYWRSRHWRRRELVAAAVGVLGAVVLLPRWWAYCLVREAAAAEGAYSLVAGPEDSAFFGDGWHRPVDVGAVTGRYSSGSDATMFVPVFDDGDVLLKFRMQACATDPERVRKIRVSVNDGELTTLNVVWNPEKADSYDVWVPRAMLREGWNRVELAADGSTVIPQTEDRFVGAKAGWDTAFFLQYVRVIPQPPPSGSVDQPAGAV